jgi:hypothetical protein
MPRRRGPEAEVIGPARRRAIEATTRLGHAEDNGHSPQQDQHSADDGHAAGKHHPGHREHRPSQQELGPPAGVHGACEIHQAHPAEQRASTDEPADPPGARQPGEPGRTVPAGRPGCRAPHHQALPVRS